MFWYTVCSEFLQLGRATALIFLMFFVGELVLYFFYRTGVSGSLFSSVFFIFFVDSSSLWFCRLYFFIFRVCKAAWMVGF